MVAASGANKAVRLADFFTDFLAGPAPGKQKFTLDPAEQRLQQQQRVAAKQAIEVDRKALWQIQTDIDRGRAISPSDLHNLTDQNKLAIKQFGDKGLQDMLEAERQRREQDYGSER